MQSTGIHREQAATGGHLVSLPPVSPASPGPRYYSVKATAALLDVKRLFVYRRFHAGVFPGRKAGRKIDIYAVFVDALRAEIDSGRTVDVDEFAMSWRAAGAVAS